MLKNFIARCQYIGAFIVSKKVKPLQKSGPGRPMLVACNLKCFEIDLICWQLISVKATKRLLGLLSSICLPQKQSILIS